MIRRLLAATFVLALALPAMADDKFDTKKLKGTWLREVENLKLTYQFKSEDKMVAKVMPPGADKAIIVEADITIDKNGVLSGVITKVDTNGNEGGPAKGDKFSFRIEIGKETLIVSDFKGIEGDVKQLVEGEYKRQTD
jgi:hypothetical protein